MSTLREVLDQHVAGDVTGLLEALTAREDNMADLLRLAGAQFGAEPAFVAEVLAQIGLGTPPTPEGRALIRQQFETRLAEYQEMYRRQQGGE